MIRSFCKLRYFESPERARHVSDMESRSSQSTTKAGGIVESEALAARLACSCSSGFLPGALFYGQASISLDGWITVSVTYLLSGRSYRGDDMQAAWTEVRASARMLAARLETRRMPQHYGYTWADSVLLPNILRLPRSQQKANSGIVRLDVLLCDDRC